MIDIKDVITLDDKNKYIVMAKTLMDDNIYLYLLDAKDYTNYKFCLLDKDSGNKLSEINDKETLKTLVKLFSKELRKNLRME
jgi:hypothetical protein